MLVISVLGMEWFMLVFCWDVGCGVYGWWGG